MHAMAGFAAHFIPHAAHQLETFPWHTDHIFR